jgi:hypothetical protein
LGTAATSSRRHPAVSTTLTGTRPAVVVDTVFDILCASFDLEPNAFSIHLHHPEDFLIIFRSQHNKDRVSGDHFIGDLNVTLNLQPWCKLAHTNVDRLEHRVEIELRGIPAQSWHHTVVEFLLRGCCWVKSVHQDTLTPGHGHLLAFCAHP